MTTYPMDETGAVLAVKKAEQQALDAARAFGCSCAGDDQTRSMQTLRALNELELAASRLSAADSWLASLRSNDPIDVARRTRPR